MKIFSKKRKQIGAFWVGGAEAYESGLRDHYAPKIAELRKQIELSRVDSERASLESALQSLEDEYRSKAKDVDALLF